MKREQHTSLTSSLTSYSPVATISIQCGDVGESRLRRIKYPPGRVFTAPNPDQGASFGSLVKSRDVPGWPGTTVVTASRIASAIFTKAAKACSAGFFRFSCVFQAVQTPSLYAGVVCLDAGCASSRQISSKLVSRDGERGGRR